MDLAEYTKEQIWQMLVDSVHAHVMFKTHKAYTRDVVLPEKADISTTELAERLNMPIAEAIIILEELKESQS